MTVKLSISLPDEDVAYLDALKAPSRSAAVHRAIMRARNEALDGAYAQAFAEWDESDHAVFWNSHSGDGVE